MAPNGETATADAMIAAAHRMCQGIAFAWEPELGDLGGIKPLSAEEQKIFPLLRRTPDAIAQVEASRQLFRRHFAETGTPVVDPTDALATMRRSSSTICITRRSAIELSPTSLMQLKSELVNQLAIAKVRRR
jgi:hypothetical protein